MITLFTPTYNRAHLLPRLYDSLRAQSCFDFEWLIVDDGSADDTASVVKVWQEECADFPVRYYSQINQGKHIAINKGMEEAAGEWFLVVDSDDYLKPEAVATIVERTRQIENRPDYCGVTLLRVYDNGDIVGGNSAADRDFDSDYFSYRHVHDIAGDRAEVFRTSALRQYPFPKFEGEKFMTESVLCFRMARDYKSLFTHDALYVCEYQDDGLSSSTQKLYNNNPLGCMLNAVIAYGHPECSLRYKLRYAGYFRHYHRLAKAKGAVIPPDLRPLPGMKFLGFVAEFLRLLKNKGNDPLRV